MIGAIRNTLPFLLNHPLTRRKRAAAIFRFVKWQVQSRIQDETIFPWVGKTRLAVRRGMTGATGNIYAGLHEFYDMAFTLHFLRNDDTFFDIGANVGTYTILASGVCGSRSVSFEPNLQAMTTLKRNIEINNIFELVRTENIALGAEHGKAFFTDDQDTMNRISEIEGKNTTRVRVERLDDVVQSHPALIKIDVEGYEEFVFGGAQRTLESPQLQAVITEGRESAAVAPLLKAGFTEHKYDPWTRQLSKATGAREGNALYIRDAVFVHERLVTAPAFNVLNFEI